ncbi:molecular chaperone [Enterobacter sp. ENT03]|uniref:fimbrial biogenesis chaperone n=1 Tax=Enterobacter sp. ENT03 TaxID=2854780 RepID=UPI001C458D26|nr:molecular chaperone [Enterobacter sp. ENT03]MBV7406160.1 molecular chaperone [Enterobacter sp. ENT03]
MRYFKIILTAVLFLLFVRSQAYAGVVTQATRIIYQGDAREATLLISNTDKNEPFLVQSWIDNKGVDGTQAETSKPPFIVTPPLFRLEAQADNSLRIVYTGGALPADRESVFWLNVKAIPRSAQSGNVLQVAIKTRIKLFWRPQGLGAMPPEPLRFRRDAQSLVVTNTSPYYVTFQHLDVGGAAVATGSQMVPPRGTARYPLGAATGSRVNWQTINDFGGASVLQHAPLQ